MQESRIDSYLQLEDPSPMAKRQQPDHSAQKTMNILTRLNVGGPSIQVITLNVGLVLAGFNSLLVVGKCEPGEKTMDYLLDGSEEIRMVPQMSRSVRPFRNMLALWHLWRIFRREQPQIVHTHTAMAGCLGRVAALLAGVPVIIHTYHGNSLRGYFSPAANSMFVQIERILARATDAICVLCEQQLTELCDEFRIAPRSKFRIVPLGLDLDVFTSSAPVSQGNGRLTVGWFGRLVPIKNVALLIQVIESTLEVADDVQFLIAGDGPDRELMVQATQRFGHRLVWYGWQEDIAPLVEKCSLLIQTSHNEGTPVALIQGMAAGRPFISTSAGGIVNMTCGLPQSFTSGARWFDNAIIADPVPEAFAKVLKELSQHPKRILEMGESARSFATEVYRKEALIPNLVALYRELLKRKLPHLNAI